jgi:hypothetical protein
LLEQPTSAAAMMAYLEVLPERVATVS